MGHDLEFLPLTMGGFGPQARAFSRSALSTGQAP
jgi:hypothetical protein